MARASVAAHSRRDRSVNTGDKAACFARSVATSTGEPYHAVISQYKRLMFDGPLLARVIRSAAVAAHVLRVRSPTKERLPNHHVQGEPTRLRVQVPEPLCLRRGQRQ